MGMQGTMAQFSGSGVLICTFKILDTGGTPTITEVGPPSMMASSLSIVDTGTGDYAVTLKNFKAPAGVAKVFCTTHTISVFASCTSRTYSSEDLALVFKVENDASSATDASVDVLVIAY